MASALPTHPLGTSGMDVTRVGLGAWAMGGGGYFGSLGSQDDEASVAAIRHAVERGVNWIDTAAVYGHGHSEQVVGRAVASFAEADRPYVFTKDGLVWDPSDRNKQAARVGRPVSAVAVAWTLAVPGVTGAIVGARSPEQVDGWLPAASLSLTGADLDTIAAAIASTGAGSGPTRPGSA